jgi:hypothetical protein
MTEDTKIKYSDLQELMKYCDNAIDNLNRLHEQLVKIIAVKNTLAKTISSSVVFSQAQNIVGAAANLEKIDARLSGAIEEVKQLSQQVQLKSDGLWKSKNY